MAAVQRTTVVGVFTDRQHADKAITELHKAGFTESQIGVAMPHDESFGKTHDLATAEDTHAGSGALTGALTGIGLGALAGLGVLAGVIPVIGPAIAGGTLGILFSNAAVGAGIAGLTGALVGAGVPEEEAHYYQSELESGGTIVTVQAAGRVDEASAILRRNGAYDMQTKGTGATASSSAALASSMNAGKASVASRASASDSMSTGSRTVSGTGNQKIEVREEELHAHTRPVDAGEVRVRKEVTTEHRTIEVPVQHEEVVIERHAASGRASSGDIRAGEEIRIPVMDEEVIVDKKAVVKEEISVGKRTVQGTERVSGDIRKENVYIDQKGDVDIRGDAGKGKGKA